jgi:nitrogen regulatory protein P-II 1
MQLITAVVAPSRIHAVLNGLRTLGARGWNLSVAYVPGHRPVRVVRLDLVAANADTPDFVRVITRTIDGKLSHSAPAGLWVTPVDVIVRIRTGEHGPDAVQ